MKPRRLPWTACCWTCPWTAGPLPTYRAARKWATYHRHNMATPHVVTARRLPLGEPALSAPESLAPGPEDREA